LTDDLSRKGSFAVCSDCGRMMGKPQVVVVIRRLHSQPGSMSEIAILRQQPQSRVVRRRSKISDAQ
jgi:hypothetical protein